MLFSGFLHYFVLAKLATSSMRAKILSEITLYSAVFPKGIKVLDDIFQRNLRQERVNVNYDLPHAT